MSRLVGALVAVLALVSCAHGPVNTTGKLAAAAADADGPNADARTLALAGFEAVLVRGDLALARLRFDAAMKRDSHDPYALYGELYLARHEGHPERALDAALSVCELAPEHPLAVAAARFVAEVSGAAVPLDREILERGQRALSHGLRGDAAYQLRITLLALQGLHRDAAAEQTTLAALGQPEAVTVVGPLSAYSLLDFDQVTPPEKTGSLADRLVGPFGPVAPRTLDFPGGHFSLAGEGAPGDVFLVAVDAEVHQPGTYVLRTATAGTIKAFLDGEPLVQRNAYAHSASTVNEVAVSLEKGWHRLLYKTTKEELAPAFSIALMRADGKPANLSFRPAAGPAPRWHGLSRTRADGLYPLTRDLYEALLPEAGEALATFLAVRDGIHRDRDGAKALLGAMEPFPAKAPAWTSLRAEVSLGDHTLPAKVGHGRATRDLESTLDRDRKDVPALLTRANLALEDQQLSQASELIQEARAAHTPVGFPVLILESRTALQLGVDAQAEVSAEAALKTQPGLCEALSLRYDLAQRRDAVAEADALVAPLSSCPNEETRLAEHDKLRGDLDAAAASYAERLARDPLNLNLGRSASDALVALRRYDDALKLLAAQRTAWPRNPALPKRMAEVLELAGRHDEALKLKEAALALDGSDLSLRRSVARAKTGKELLESDAIRGEDAILAYEKSHGPEEAAATYVLDAAAIHAYPDGSMVDRIHIIQKVLDQSGVQETAEVNLPSGAQILSLRTRKADGRVLEPESIEGKDTVSLPGVQVGDYVEYEYLYAHPARGPAIPGWTASNYYFQIARIPDPWCTYTIIAPKGSHMGVDAHHMQAPSPELRGDEEVYHQETRNNPPFLPEPESPPNPNEYLPFVSVGAGATGEDAQLSALSDGLLEKTRRSTEVDGFAHDAKGTTDGRATVEAIYRAVHTRISGRDQGLSVSAAASLSSDRGSRLTLLKASLEAAGIPARFAVVRTFASDPAPYRYPSDSLVGYICVVAFPKGSEPVWLDAIVRFAPFGELPEIAAGGREAWLLPEPGRSLEHVKTPATHVSHGKKVQLTLALSPDGKLSGQGQETYVGFEAAQLGEQLDALGPQERDQALQGALGRYFGGAEMTGLELQNPHTVGGALVLRYKFVAPRFARADGGQLTLGALTFPAYLGRHYVQLSSRRTPLYVGETEESDTHVTLALPPGYRVDAPLGAVKKDTPFGAYMRSETQKGSTLTLDEHYRLNMARIAPTHYADFAGFAGEVDLLQARELTVYLPGTLRQQALRPSLPTFN